MAEDAYQPPDVEAVNGNGGGAETAQATTGPAALSLAEIEATISAFIRNGAIQSYTVNGRTVQRAALSSLIAWRDKLLAERAAQNPNDAINIFRRGSY